MSKTPKKEAAADASPGLTAVTKRLWNESKQRVALVVLTFISLITALAQLLVSRAGGRVAEQVLAFDGTALLNALLWLGGLMLIEGIIGRLYDWYRVTTREKIAIRLRALTAQRVAGATFTWTQAQKTGDLIGRVQDDIRNAILYISEWLPHLVQLLLKALVLAVYMSTVNGWLVLAFFAPLPALLVFQIIMSKPLQKPMEKMMASNGIVNAQVQDIITNRTTVKSYQLEKISHGWLQAAVKDRIQKTMRAMLLMCGMLGPSIMISILPMMLFCGIAGTMVVNSTLSVANAMAMFLMVWPIGMEFGTIAERLSDIQRGAATGARIFPLWDAPQEQLAVASGIQPDPNAPAVALHNVTFAYPAEDNKTTPLLKGFDLTLRQGESVALAGPSGCGKSTVLKLVSALYPPDTGHMQAYGHDYQSWQLEDLRTQMAVVNQDTFLFPSSIRDNLCYGVSEGVSEERLVQACKDAELWEFIEALPERLDTVVGERGVKLSGGQRQRVAIARALLRNAPLLLLDEATSSLDVVTEKEVQRTLDRLMKGRTALIVAHRLSTIRNVDRIVVMDEGQIQEQGSHDELLHQGGLYARLYRSQSEEAEGGVQYA